MPSSLILSKLSRFLTLVVLAILPIRNAYAAANLTGDTVYLRFNRFPVETEVWAVVANGVIEFPNAGDGLFDVDVEGNFIRIKFRVQQDFAPGTALTLSSLDPVACGDPQAYLARYLVGSNIKAGQFEFNNKITFDAHSLRIDISNPSGTTRWNAGDIIVFQLGFNGTATAPTIPPYPPRFPAIQVGESAQSAARSTCIGAKCNVGEIDAPLIGDYAGEAELISYPSSAALAPGLRSGYGLQNECDPVPEDAIHGMVLPHEHLLSEYAFGSGWLHGKHEGPIAEAAAMCDGGFDHGRIKFAPLKLEQCAAANPGLILLIKTLKSLIDKYLLRFVDTKDEFDYHQDRREGFPGFSGWPRWDTTTHIQYWEGWLKQAFDRGVRMVVMSAVSFKFLCELLPAENREFDCDEMVSVDKQLLTAVEFTSTRPWIQIALTPEDARRIIAQGKMAMVLHVEASDIFGFDNDLPQQLEKYTRMGVRSFQIAHQLDNRFAGVGHHMPAFFLAQFVRDCPAGTGSWCQSCFVDSESDCDLLQFNVGKSTVTLPILGHDLDANCKNVVGLRTEGSWLVQEMISRGMLIDIAHISEKAVADVYNISVANNYYPIYMSHGHFQKEAIPSRERQEKLVTIDTIDKIMSTGGIFGLRTGNEEVKKYAYSGVANSCDGSTRSFAQSYQFGRLGLGVDMAFAMDLQSLAKQVRPMYGPYGACGESKFETDQICQPMAQNELVNERLNTDFDEKGLGHIGQAPDLRDQLAVLGVNTDNLEASTEKFVRMWERVAYRTGRVALPARSPALIADSAFTYKTNDQRKSAWFNAKLSCVQEGHNPDTSLLTRMICRSGRYGCKHNCIDTGAECKDVCKVTKGACKQTCKDTKESCITACNNISDGKQRRQCRRGCRSDKRDCRSECQADKKECKSVCKGTKKACKTQCKVGRLNCLVERTDDFSQCQCTKYVNT